MAKKRVKPTTVVTLHFDDNRIARTLFGPEDRHLRQLEKTTGVEIGARGIYTNGLGHTYRLQIHHMGRVEVSLFRDGGGVMRGQGW